MRSVVVRFVQTERFLSVQVRCLRKVSVVVSDTVRVINPGEERRRQGCTPPQSLPFIDLSKEVLRYQP